MIKSTRKLQHSKSARVRTGSGRPRNAEGVTGDLYLGLTKSGLKLFAKHGGTWYLVGQGNLNKLGGVDADQQYQHNNEKISTIDKAGRVKIKEKGEINIFPWTIKSTRFDAAYDEAEQGLMFSTRGEDASIIFGEQGTIKFKNSEKAYFPQFYLENAQNNTNGPWLNLYHNDANPAIGQDFGIINFQSNDDAGNQTTYAWLSGQANSITDGSEGGKFNLRVKAAGNNHGVVVVGNADGTGYISATTDFYATGKLYIDGVGGDTYFNTTSDVLDLYVGNDNLIKLTENGADGNTFDFENCAAGFTRREQTFSTTDVKGTGGTDDTDIDFRVSNKFRLEMTGDIAQMNLIFPPVSGNFTLVTSTNGDHDVTAWKVWESDETAASTTDVMWAGGSVPAFTNNGVDICSFYWDATEQQCYGVCSLAFATP